MPIDATKPMVQVYVRGYIMMLLSTMLFGNKSGARVHLRWLSVANRNVKNLAGPLALLQSWIFWRFPKFRPRRFDVIPWPLASRWGRYMPSSDEKGPRVIATRHRLDKLRVDDDGRGPIRWFSEVFATWHEYWDQRHQSVLTFQLVPDPRPSVEYLDWWYRVAHRFLSNDQDLVDPHQAGIPQMLQFGVISL
ncbi:hypothetical protein Ahy_B10g101491 [Arachis hypogaea]|uniref:Aminotransferase-like plant mobile domain-containing protein n=1 Tax=Arachis hypogaea TaxID=3818 RepID=A0A444WZM1_ARAHY|nr:hypothetical protein Ahy_B10g101491 [Arachis hypogaea]